MEELGTILGVWAHPDDEGYLSAGIMATAARNGQRVVCVTATRGEAADPDRWPPEDLAKIREGELYACLGILGVTEHRWLDYPDGGCAAIDPDAAAARLAEIIEEVRPDTVLTFGPDGQTGHADHIAVCDWTTRAVERATHRADLHYSTHTPEWAAAFMAAAVEHNVMMADEVELPNVPRDELSIVFPMTDEILELKERAMVAQASQSADLRDAMGADAYREVLREEVFMRAPGPRTRA